MDTLSYKTKSANASTVEKKWLLIDAEGQTVGRIASQIAFLLRGKHKPSYTPHVDCGDYVIVINAEKVTFSGDKWETKEYLRHTGYPGGQRSLTARQILERDPRRLLEYAVKGMLPKNKLGSAMYRHLNVYVGSEHPHAGQNPETYELKYDSKA